MILDVGCGNDPHGDVNCDLFPDRGEHRPKASDWQIETKKIPNFVVCDAHLLPFKDRVFSLVYSYHVLEHLLRPADALAEWSRVSSFRVRVVVPDLKISRVYGDFEPHLYSWSRWSLKRLVALACEDVQVYVRRMPLQLRGRGKLAHFLNFWLKRFFIHFPFLQNSELVAEGLVGWEMLID